MQTASEQAGGTLARDGAGAFYTALRLGELEALQAGDVRPDFVRVRNRKSGKPKTVPLNSERSKFFAALVKDNQKEAPVFGYVNRMNVSRQMRAGYEAAEVEPPAVFHDLRRTYGSLLLNERSHPMPFRNCLVMRTCGWHAGHMRTCRTRRCSKLFASFHHLRSRHPRDGDGAKQLADLDSRFPTARCFALKHDGLGQCDSCEACLLWARPRPSGCSDIDRSRRSV